jgi:hypothetical protein
MFISEGIKQLSVLSFNIWGYMIVEPEGKSEEELYWKGEELIEGVFRREDMNLRPDQLRWMLKIREGLDKKREYLKISKNHNELSFDPVQLEEILNYKPRNGVPYDVSAGKFAKAFSSFMFVFTILVGPLIIGGALAFYLFDYGWILYTPICALLVIFLYSPWSPMVIFGFLISALIEVRAENWHSSRWR